jgi:hypothetical protein
MLLLAEIQAIVADTTGLQLTVTDIAVSFSSIILLAFWRDMNRFKQDTQTWQATIETALFGRDGTNGINGTVKDHEVRIRDLEE